MNENLSNRPKGRPLNSSNNLTRTIKKMIADIVENNLENLQSDLDQMKPVERSKVIISLLDYVSPKLRSIETNDVTDATFKPISIQINEN
jgi:hypothetical protein